MESKIENALRWIIDILYAQKVQYQLAGGLAARLYGAERPLNDIDIDVYEEDFEKILPFVREYVVYGPAE
jgi:hypothetical protein